MASGASGLWSVGRNRLTGWGSFFGGGALVGHEVHDLAGYIDFFSQGLALELGLYPGAFLGGGEDFLQGGDGNDIFRFLDPSDGVSAEDGVFGLFDGDFVDDFASGVDKFQFDGTAFGFGAFTGTLTLNTNFFVEADFDGTSTGGGTPTGAYVVFDPNTFNLYTDAAQNDGGYTVVANLGATPVAGDIEII